MEILRALLASKLGTLAIVDLGERLESARTKVKDVIRGVDEEVSLDDERKYLEKVLTAISKVKALVSYQEKLDDKSEGTDGKKAKAPKAHKSQDQMIQEIKKRERQVEAAFQDIAFNRKTINQLSGKIKGYWGRGKELIDERKKVFDFLGIKDVKQIREINWEFKKSNEYSCGPLPRVRCE